MSLIEDLINAKDKTYSSAIRVYMAKEQKLRQEKYLWKGRISVSSIESFNCCPKQIIVNSKKAKWFKIKTLYKADLGKAIHKMYQEAAMNTPNLKFIKPYNMPEYLKERLEKVWPEIPVAIVDPDTGEILISGIADDVENYYRNPVVIDIKSTGEDAFKFKNEFEKHYPLSKHEMQVKLYGMMMNRDNYYAPLRIKQTKLLYIHTRLETGDPDTEQEVYMPITDEDETKFELLIKEVIIQVRDIEAPCSYRYCSNHG